MLKEIWKDILGFEDYYQVSNLGNVRSKDRIIIEKTNDIQNWKGQMLKPFDNGSGYLTVHIRKNGKRYVKYVHRLVAEAFIGDTTNYDINHKDFNRKNNRLDNLEITTRKENINYSIKAGKYINLYKQRLEKTIQKYNNVKDNIINDIKNGIPIYKIEKKYGVNHKTLKKYGFY